MNPLTPDALVAHEAFVLKLARGLTRDEASALDLRQETLVTAMEAPPRDGGLRGWLSVTLRSRKVDQDRRDAGRRRREESVARSEALVQDSAAPLEQLELNHSVVQAVLELEDPYRSVVMAVYYEGLTPHEIAERTGVKAGTVRSQLSRAHDQLRAKLDREHDGRSVWVLPLMGLPLMGLVVQKEGGAAAVVKTGGAKAGGAAGGSGLVLPLGGWSALSLGVAALSTVGVWLVMDRQGDAMSPAPPAALVQEDATDSEALTSTAAAGLPRLVAPQASRRPLKAQPKGAVSEAVLGPLAEELPGLLERVRELRWELLQRAMTIRPEVAERYADLGDSGGVVRLLNRERYGADWSLPWMRGGGGFYSFSTRSRSYTLKSQVSLMGERLYLEAQQYVGVPLGAMSLRSVSSMPAMTGAALNEKGALAYELAWREERHSVLNNHRGPNYVLPKEGHSYLLRLATQGDFDILVACEVLELDEDGCTLAWRILKDWLSEDEGGGAERTELPAVPQAGSPALSEVGEEELRAQLAQALSRAQEALFESHPAPIEERYGHLRDEEGSGLARLLAFEGPWTEFVSGEGHGAEVSPLTGAHDDQHAYLGYRDDGGVGELTPSLSCYLGLVCDLGSVPLDSVQVRGLFALDDARVKLALDPWFGAAPPRPADPSEHGATYDAERYWKTVRPALRGKLEEAGERPHARALVGHTYLVRSMRNQQRNLLFAVHVAGLDEYGVIVVWRLLDDRPWWPYR